MRANIKDPEYLNPCEYRDTDVDLHHIFTCGEDFEELENPRVGDVAYCIHGHIWVIELIYPYSGLPLAKKLSPILNPLKHRKAVSALAHSDTPEIAFGIAAKARLLRYKEIVESDEG